MAQVFVAEVIDDGPAYGTDLQSRLSSIGSLFSGNGVPPVGTVEWRSGGSSAEGAVTGFAAPLFPFLQQVPMIGEFVLCVGVPMPTGDGPTSAAAYYYIGPIMIDGSRNRNLAPGVFQRGATPIPLTVSPVPPIFPKKAIPKLAPLVGDTIIEDRHGSSIRMSATQLATAITTNDPTKASQFPWTKPGPNPNPLSPPFVTALSAGNPIMILSTGNVGKASPALLKKAAGAPATLVESISSDMSTIYLTSDQQLNYFLPFPAGTARKQPIASKSDKQISFEAAINEPRVSNKQIIAVGEQNAGLNPGSANGKIIGTAKGETTLLAANPHCLNDFTTGPVYPIPKGGQINDVAFSQIFMRSHRIVLDARLDSVLISADRDVKMATKNWRMEVDSSMSLINELFNQVTLLTMHCQELTDILCEHMRVSTEMQFPTGVGPTGPMLKFYKDQMDKLRSQLGGFSAGATNPKPEPDFEASTTYKRFVERQTHINDLFKEFAIQRVSQADKEKTKAGRKA
jgi:hypothetical protein